MPRTPRPGSVSPLGLKMPIVPHVPAEALVGFLFWALIASQMGITLWQLFMAILMWRAARVDHDPATFGLFFVNLIQLPEFAWFVAILIELNKLSQTDHIMAILIVGTTIDLFYALAIVFLSWHLWGIGERLSRWFEENPKSG